MTDYNGITYSNQTVVCDSPSTFTNCVWNNWNSGDIGTVVTTGTVWYNWNDCTDNDTNNAVVWDQRVEVDTGSVVSVGTTWEYWAEEADEQVEKIKHSRGERKRLAQLAEQQRKDDLKRERAAKRRTKIELRKKFKAEHKAMELLTDLLEPDQIEVYKKTGRVLVKGNEFDWLIERYKQYRKEEFAPYDNVHVKKIKKGKIHDLCVSQQKQMELPSTDRVIGFALMAKANEKAFEKEVNVMSIADYQEKEAAVM